MLGVDREVVWEYDEYIHLFHKREFNEKMEPAKREYLLNSGGCLLTAPK